MYNNARLSQLHCRFTSFIFLLLVFNLAFIINNVNNETNFSMNSSRFEKGSFANNWP